jgi:putative drug exporter of the RND superfamily
VIIRVARFCYRSRRLVLGAWVLVFLFIGALQGSAGTNYHTEFKLPSSDSKKGFDVLKDSFGAGSSGFDAQIVFEARQGVNDQAVKAAMTSLFEKYGKVKGLVIASPYAPQGARQVSAAGPEAGKLAFAQVTIAETIDQQQMQKIGRDIRADVPKIEGLTVLTGGQAFGEFKPPESELIGIAFAVIILIAAFGSVLAMGLPIGTALFGIGLGSGLVVLLSHIMQMPDFTSFIGVMIGLGVGIDYALFIISRYRENLADGMGHEDGVVEAMDTAGRAVLFAGITVVISVLGMYAMGLAFIRGLATGAAVTVLAVLAATMTLLPALLGFADSRINITRRRGILAAGAAAISFFGFGIKVKPLGLLGVALAAFVLAAGFVIPWLRKELPLRKPHPLRETVWYRWSRVIQHRPWTAAIASFAVLAILALPVFGLRLGFSDEGNYPEKTQTRQAYDLISKGFGPGFSSPMVVVARLSGQQDLATMAKLQAAISADPNVAFVSPPIPNNPTKPTAALLRVISKTSPQDVQTDDLVKRLRATVVPGAVAGSAITPFVAGNGAANLDFSTYLGHRTPVFFAAVLGLSFLLLMMVFRSLLVPLKAVVMNLLSIGAAYGVVVAVFQWGWLKSIVGIGKGGPIEPFLPMMLFAIVFGLSMDYEVFLLSRMKEEFDRTGDNKTAVADGLAMTARVITAAAAIMFVVFGAFLLEEQRVVKMFGTGLAVAVLLDATIVRMVLVPATMELLGARNWWMPKWLARLLPEVHIEGHRHEAPVPVDQRELVDAR